MPTHTDDEIHEETFLIDPVSQIAKSKSPFYQLTAIILGVTLISLAVVAVIGESASTNTTRTANVKETPASQSQEPKKKSAPSKATAKNQVAPKQVSNNQTDLKSPNPKRTYEITIRKNGFGNGSIKATEKVICDSECQTYSQSYSGDFQLTITAVPTADSIFVGWIGHCKTNPCTISSTSADLTATFNQAQTAPNNPTQFSESVIQPPTQSAEANATKIAINEILFNPPGSDVGKEFITLYNSGSDTVDLAGWSLKISTGGNAPTSLIKIGSSKSDSTLIRPHKYFLIGLNNYSSTPPPDTKRSTSMPNSNATIYLFNPDNVVVESVSYADSIPDGSSLIKHPGNQSIVPNATPSPQNSSS